LEVLTAGRRKIHFDLSGAHDVITIAKLAHSLPPASCWLKHKQISKDMMNSFHESVPQCLNWKFSESLTELDSDRICMAEHRGFPSPG
jgi:hypothetical protein